MAGAVAGLVTRVLGAEGVREAAAVGADFAACTIHQRFSVRTGRVESNTRTIRIQDFVVRAKVLVLCRRRSRN